MILPLAVVSDGQTAESRPPPGRTEARCRARARRGLEADGPKPISVMGNILDNIRTNMMMQIEFKFQHISLFDKRFRVSKTFNID